jgi:hypothetical protein
MSINAHCGSCNRELLLGQLVQPSDGFRCPVCGFAFAPAYATVAPGVAARVMAAQAVLVTELAELGSMTGDRLRLDRATVVDPVANTLPRAEAKQPALWPAGAMPTGGPAALPHSPPNHSTRLRVHRERRALPGRCGIKESRRRITSTGRPLLLPAVGTGPSCPDAEPHRYGPWRGPSTVVRSQAGLIAGVWRRGGGLGERSRLDGRCRGARSWAGGCGRSESSR